MNDVLTRDEMMAHARDWIVAWNNRDLRTVLDAYERLEGVPADLFSSSERRP